MSTPQPTPDATPLTVADLLAGAEDVSDEEANAEIDLPLSAPAANALPKGQAEPTKPASEAEATTPSVRIAIDKAADILRQLRGES